MSTTDTHHSQATPRGRAARRRRHRRIAAVVIVAVLAALVLGLGAAGHFRDSATPPPPAPPDPHPVGGLTLAAEPFLAKQEGNQVRPGAAPVALSGCVSSPLTWGAAESGAATYGSPGEPRFGNEFVLRFDNTAAAHRALINALRQFRHCDPDPWGPPAPGGRWGLSEYIAVQSGQFAARHSVSSRYSLRVARHRNVVVVVETTGSDDRPGLSLGVAMARATGDRQRERAILSEAGRTSTPQAARPTKQPRGLYASCDEEEEDEAGRLPLGTPGYGPERDGLGDGVACVS